jgi:hypothetical protein
MTWARDSVVPQRVFTPFSIPIRHYASTTELIWLVFAYHPPDPPTFPFRGLTETDRLTLAFLSFTERVFLGALSRSYLQSQLFSPPAIVHGFAFAFCASDRHYRDNRLSTSPPRTLYSSIPPFLQRPLPPPLAIPLPARPPMQNANKYRILSRRFVCDVSRADTHKPQRSLFSFSIPKVSVNAISHCSYVELSPHPPFFTRL